MLSDLLKRALYLSGALGVYHRLRNARTLTVIMFHRVLDPADPRWAHCDPDYTLRVDVFAKCLQFFRAHYNMVSAEEVLRVRGGTGSLPPRALLVTFDDGWADNVDFALPRMRELGVPGLMFVVSDAVGRKQPFYQERLVSAWRRGSLSVQRLAALLRAAAGTSVAAEVDESLPGLRCVIAGIEALPSDVRQGVLASLAPDLDDGLAHMVTTDDLVRLDREGVTIGLHGKTHVPMTRATDLDAELSGARAAMASLMRHRPAPATMSFPHGRFDADIAQQARQAGFELLFTSVPVLNPTGSTLGWLLGRLGFEADAVVDRAGRFRPDLLALYLFRQPCRRLA